MKYLVTGSSGFIGTHLVNTLKKQGHHIRLLDPKDGSGDIRDLQLLSQSIEDIDGVFHLGAIASVQASIEDPAGTFETNVSGTQNVFQAAAAKKTPIVYASSAAIYGDNKNLPLSENEPPKPLSPYAEHKLQNECDAALFGQEYGVRTFGLRFFNIYGPGQDPSSPYSGVISVFHDRLKAGKPITIYGDGLQTRDFVAVKDAVSGLITAMQHVSVDAPIANLCTGQTTSLLDLATALGNKLNIEPVLIHEPPRSGDIRHSQGNCEYLQNLAGFKPNQSLSEGLDALLGTH